MMKMIVLLMSLLVVLTGCGNKFGRSTTDQAKSNVQSQGAQVQQTNQSNTQPLTNPQITLHLEELAARIPNVESAHVVLFGKTAIVGINVNAQLDRAKIDTVKYSVAEALRKDPYGANAIVTADIDLDARLRQIGQEVRNGRPLSGFADELGKIVGRLMPQLPRDVVPGQQSPASYPKDGTPIQSNL